jgi:PAS domain S-box-containing protein
MWDEGHCEIFGVDAKSFKVTPERVRALIDPADWDRLSQLWFGGGVGSKSFETEFRVRRPDGEVRWCFGTAAATVDESSRLVRVSGVTTDITQRKRAEERQSILTGEVDHRARNVLAVVQSILRLTKSQNIDSYIGAVEGRIKALSHAHMLLSESRWEGADLRRLVTEELDPYRISDAVSIDGPETILDPRRAQTLALAVHELATNSAKYGALSASSGKVTLSWRNAENRLTIDWTESGGPDVRPPDTQGYGTKVIRASLEQLGGRAVFDWHSTGLRCALSLPHDDKVKLSNGGRGPTHTADDSGSRFKLGSIGNRVLLVEDESMVAMMVEQVLTELGLCVVGPYGTIDDALQAVRESPVDAAILDINLGGQSVYPLVDFLTTRGVPTAFISGYGVESVDRRYGHIPLMQKPIDRQVLLNLFNSIRDAEDAIMFGRAQDLPASADAKQHG